MANFEALKTPFPSDGLEWRVQQAGEKKGKIWALVVPYVTNRAIMDRLDNAIGAPNWRNEFHAGPEGGVLCGLSIRVDDEWVTKWDGAENTDIEGVKGGLSGAMKRAAVHWGIGRYLYALDEGFATVSENGAHRGKTKDGKAFRWDPPKLPAWALPPSRAPEAESFREPPARTPKPTAESVSITDEQRTLLEKLMRSHVVTDAEREKMTAAVEKGMSKERATRAIDTLLTEIAARKAVETQEADDGEAAIAARDETESGPDESDRLALDGDA